MQELRNIAPTACSEWMILGDFNLVYQAEDKSNTNLDRRLMGSFNTTLDDLLLTETCVNGRKFTWSNERENPTLTRIDRILVTNEWKSTLPQLIPTLPTNSHIGP